MIFGIAVLSFLMVGCEVTSTNAPESNESDITLTSACDNYVPGTSVNEDYLCAHNDVRANAQPAPVPALADFTWNAALSTVAQSYAETCVWAHNANRTTQYAALSGQSGYVGENIYMNTGTSITPAHAVASWAAEESSYDYTSNTCATGQVCGHYTQLVWRNTTQIGCGMNLCGTLDVDGTNYTNVTLVVCDYAPGGNIIGQSPY